MQWGAEKLGVQYGLQCVKIMRVNGASVICQTAEVSLWLLAKQPKSPHLNPNSNAVTEVCSFHVAPALPNSRTAGVSQCCIFAAAQNECMKL